MAPRISLAFILSAGACLATGCSEAAVTGPTTAGIDGGGSGDSLGVGDGSSAGDGSALDGAASDSSLNDSGLSDSAAVDAKTGDTASFDAATDTAVDSAPDSSGDSSADTWTPAGKPPVVKGGLGWACNSQSDCTKGLFCAGAGSPGGYCASAGCDSHADCEVATDDPMCCVTYGEIPYCFKQLGGSSCGYQTKAPGESCSSGIQSDCDPAGGAFCFNVGKSAQCVAGCKDSPCAAGSFCQDFGQVSGCIPYTPGKADGTPCASAPISGCGAGSLCIGAFSGDPLAYCAKPCGSDAGCAAGYACAKWSDGQGLCQKYGAKALGASCSDDRFSCAKGLWCLGNDGASSICSHSCKVNGDCQDFANSVGGQGFCLIQPGQGSGLCWPAGAKANGDSCGKDPLSCAPGSWCIGGYDQYNPDAYCQKGCSGDGQCPAGSICVQLGPSYAGCQVKGPKAQGESCAGAPTSCQAGHLCLGPQGAETCTKLCKPGATSGSADSCPSGTWCSGWGNGFGSCLKAGTAAVGSSCAGKPDSCAPGSFCQGWGQGDLPVCIAVCGPGDTCPSGTDCKDFGQAGKYCQPLGGKPQGEFCASTAECAKGHVCIAAGQPHAMCSKQCVGDSDCGPSGGKPGGLWCGVGKWGGYCLPDGSGGEFASCFGKPWQCQKGLVCLGDASTNPAAFCTKECSGFASVCGAGAKCQYLGSGQSWCYKAGSMAHGMPCLEQPQACDPATLCVKGSPIPTCLQLCGVGKPACPDGSPCTWFPGSALQLCVPKGFLVGGAIRAPF